VVLVAQEKIKIMVTVVYCTRETNPTHKEHLIKSSGLHKHIEVIEIINNGESLTKAYNRGLNQAKYDIVVFCHDDLTIETKQWGNKLVKLFDKNTEYGIIGVAGSKNMPVSGQWWENRSKMFGRVAHTHEGKTWLSSYSDDLGQNLEETVIVDGVWFAVDKRRVKKTFNENVEGFHFYDVTFAFENYLEGVKVGVTTLIRINHQSIGMTNEAWEKNRADFSEAFQTHLPANVKRTIHKGQRFKIMLSSLSFNGGSELELTMLQIAIELKKIGHEVTIVSLLGGPLDKTAKKHGIKLAPIQEPPAYKLGDGKWVLNTPQGPRPSVEKTLYKVQDVNFDVIHVFNDELIDHYSKLYPDNNIINTQFVDGLFISDVENDKVVKTIKLTTNLDNVNAESLNKIISDYIETL
jgi:glycosyltransferase involved in cell wall biosynthesis